MRKVCPFLSWNPDSHWIRKMIQKTLPGMDIMMTSWWPHWRLKSPASQLFTQSFIQASLAFVWGIHLGPVNSPHKWPVTRKMFPFDDVIMEKSHGNEICLFLWFNRIPPHEISRDLHNRHSIIPAEGTRSFEVNEWFFENNGKSSETFIKRVVVIINLSSPLMSITIHR